MSNAFFLNAWTKNKNLINWIKDKISLCQPDNVHLCNGSQEEYDQLMQSMVNDNKAIKLNRKNSFLFRSHIDDVARVEEATFICSENEKDAGPTNNWKDPKIMKEHLLTLFSGCMKGRTMYVIPFSMGPLGSDKSQFGVQITDSAYVVCNMKIMTRMGKKALDLLTDDKMFIPCMHSVGVPLTEGQKDDIWPCNPQQRVIAHFPEERSIWSFGSGYGGNALLGKKCLALRIASKMAKDEGWLAEHMLILKITSPENKVKYFAAAFPSACGKTNLAMMQPNLEGWKVECIGDDIAWMKFGKDGKLYAINPEAGFFGVATGTSANTNPNAMKTISENAIFTNVAQTEDNDVWWEGMTDEPPETVISWKNKKLKKPFEENAAHPNSRFTVSASQCPIIAKEWQDPEGVCISAMIFGGRRDDVVPLVCESFNWEHGVFLGASTSSQMTAAAKGTIGKLRHDPFAMLPFCGYNMKDYFSHWLDFSTKTKKDNLPKIFYVNWFLKDDNKKFIWPGFGDNIRVLKWMFERIEDTVSARKTQIGYLPNIEDMDLSNLDISYETLEKLFYIDRNKWLNETQELSSYFSSFKEGFPKRLTDELNKLTLRLMKEEKEYAHNYSESEKSTS